MFLLVGGLVLFLGVHSIGVVGLRDRAVATLGAGLWQISYSLVALVGLAAIVYGYGLARTSPTLLFVPPVWTRHLAVLLMVPVFPLIFAAYLPGRIRSAVRHPMLAGTGLWAASHLLANGMLADVLLFGAMLVWAIVEVVSLSRRPPRASAAAPAGRFNDGIAVVLGLGAYAATMLWLHRWLIGVPPIAFG